MRDRASWLAGLLSALLTAGCQTPPAPPPDDDEPQACPAEFQSAITLRVSVAPRQVPPELLAAEGAQKHYAVLARRLLISIAPKSPAIGASIRESTLTITPFGGTFVGWGALDGGASAALDVAPGRLRITPFLATGALHAQTRELDTVIQAGGAPLDQVAITTGPLWDDMRRPTPADAVQVTLVPIRHFTVYDLVDAKVALEFIVQKSRSEPRRLCAVETRITLIDHDAARPPLWDLGISHRGGSRKLWLALFDPKTGPVRAIFTDPIAARGFAEWAQQAGATHVSRYQLGLFEPEETGPMKVLPSDRAIMDSFRPVSPEDLSALTVRMLAEP
jgi:hypothetical protein